MRSWRYSSDHWVWTVVEEIAGWQSYTAGKYDFHRQVTDRIRWKTAVDFRCNSKQSIIHRQAAGAKKIHFNGIRHAMDEDIYMASVMLRSQRQSDMIR